jgi:hypothetical protein
MHELCTNYGLGTAQVEPMYRFWNDFGKGKVIAGN